MQERLNSRLLTSSYFNIESKEERARQALEQRRGLVKTLTLILGIAALVGIVIALPTTITTQNLNPINASLSGLICFWISFFLVFKATSIRNVLIASYLLFVGLLTALFLINITGSSFASNLAGFIIICIMAGVIEIGRIGTIVITVIGGAGLVIFAALSEARAGRDVWQDGITPIVAWGLVYIIAAGGVFTFVTRQRRTARLMEEQAEKLSHLLETINSTNKFGVTLSRDLSGVTAELSATSRQHASSTQEQVAALTEVTTSLEELSETASQIASSAKAATQLADDTVGIASEVKEASELSRSTSQEGSQAVEQAVMSVERVRNRIELLGQRLLHLTEQTRKVGTIIDIIDEIADETHLLALNASIEAAGSTMVGETPSITGNRGERFGVIAQEVKSLSDRSRESTEEVRQAISEMQGAVAAAVLVAEEGKKETAAALSRSQIAGRVIEKLNEVISNSSTGADEILTMAEEVKVRCEEISVATGQQRSANQQILVTMRGVAEVSQENAGSVSLLTETITKVNRQVDELNNVLAQSNQSVMQTVAA